jgi:hypothetical protein
MRNLYRVGLRSSYQCSANTAAKRTDTASPYFGTAYCNKVRI